MCNQPVILGSAANAQKTGRKRVTRRALNSKAIILKKSLCKQMGKNQEGRERTSNQSGPNLVASSFAPFVDKMQ
jgi:hypothetical protein